MNGIIICRSKTDRETCIFADNVRNLRQHEYDSAELYTDTDQEMVEKKAKGQVNFIDYYAKVTETRHKKSSKSIIVNWNRVQELMKIYTEGEPLPFSKIDLRLIDSFKTFLLTAPQGGGKSGIISQNTASTYFSIFKAAVHQAFIDGYLDVDLAAKVKGGAWELPEDIHEVHEKEITEACYNILREMQNYNWDCYKHGLESRGYKVHEQRDKQGVLHGYTILRGNSRFKSSTLGKGRNLTIPKLEATWKKRHPVAPSIDKPGYTIGTSQTTERKSFTEHNSARQSVAQSKAEAPSIFRKILSVGDKNYSIAMPVDTYKAMKETIESPDESVPFENVLNVAMLLFMNYVDAATTVSESCGGGGSTPSNWGRDDDKDEHERARRCVQHANWLCKPIRKYKGPHR